MPTVPASSRENPSRPFRVSDTYLAEAKAIGIRIRAARKARGWTLAEAAKHTGLGYQHIQKLEVGSLNVTLLTLIRVAAGFGVPLRTFFVDPDEAGDRDAQP